MRRQVLVAAAALTLATLAGCAGKTTVPRELVTARQSYFRTAAGPSVSVNAARLARAKEALDLSERAFRENPDSPVARDLAYMAARDAELVDAETGTMLAALRQRQALQLIRHDQELHGGDAP